MFPVWDGLKHVHSVGADSFNPTKVKDFCGRLQAYLAAPLTKGLQEAMINGPVGMEAQRQEGEYRGSLTKRVQGYLKHEYGWTFSDKGDILTTVMSQMNSSTIKFDLWARLSRKMHWSPGEFGDAGSCFWGCNQTSRYWFCNWDYFHALMLYKHVGKAGKEKAGDDYARLPDISPYKRVIQDGELYEGYGRCLMAWNYPKPGLMMCWNAYPNNQLQAYLPMIVSGLSQEDPSLAGKLTWKQVSFVNEGQGNGWFYTNNRDCFMVGPEKEIAKYSTVDVKEKRTPVYKDFEEYKGDCLCSAKILTDRGPYFSNKGLNLCSKCAKTAKLKSVKCYICKEECVTVEGHDTHPGTAKLLLDFNGNKPVKRLICPDCHKRDNPLVVNEERELVAA